MDDAIHGSGALVGFPGGMAEIAGIAVDQAYSHLGIGQKLVDFLISSAREKGYKRVFALTTQTLDWFQKLGFKEGRVDDIPQSKRRAYDTSRKSKIFIFSL